MVARHYFLTGCTHLPDNPICYSRYMIFPGHLCALIRICKQQILLLLSICTIPVYKGKQLIAAACFASTCNPLMLPELTAIGSSRHQHPTPGQGTKGAHTALKICYALESCSTAILRLCWRLFLCVFLGRKHQWFYSLPHQGFAGSYPFYITACTEEKERGFIHMHITMLPKAIKGEGKWKRQLAEEKLVHNKALVCWYPEQTQFCPVKLCTWRICVWVIGLKLPIFVFFLLKKWNNIYERSKWGKASIKSLFSFFILFPLPGNANALSVLLHSWCKGLFYTKCLVCSPITGRINS